MDEIKPAFQGEVMLAGWSETHNGGAKVTLWLQDPSDLEAFRSMTVAKGKQAGQRLACVLVEIGEDERPVQDPKLSQQAAQLCYSGMFRTWLATQVFDDCTTEAAATTALKRHLAIESRRELDQRGDAAAAFLSMVREFRRWEETKLFKR